MIQSPQYRIVLRYQRSIGSALLVRQVTYWFPAAVHMVTAVYNLSMLLPQEAVKLIKQLDNTDLQVFSSHSTHSCRRTAAQQPCLVHHPQ